MHGRVVLAPLLATLVLAGVVAQSPTQLQTRIDGRGSTVILLGGGLLGADGWGGVPERLARTHHVVNAQSLAVQYGLEGRQLPATYSLRTEVDALRNSLDALSVPSGDVVGMSHGGVTALVFALTYPSRVRSLTVIEPPAFWVLPNHGRDDAGAREMQSFVGSMRTATVTEADVERFRCLLGECTNGRSPRRAPAWDNWLTHRNSLRGLHTIGDYDDDPARLRTLTMPALIVTGADTVAFHREINRILLHLLPDARGLELTGGHNSPTSDPDYFVNEWEKFVSRSAPGR